MQSNLLRLRDQRKPQLQEQHQGFQILPRQLQLKKMNGRRRSSKSLWKFHTKLMMGNPQNTNLLKLPQILHNWLLRMKKEKKMPLGHC
jgi:hypothetical protein